MDFYNLLRGGQPDLFGRRMGAFPSWYDYGTGPEDIRAPSPFHPQQSRRVPEQARRSGVNANNPSVNIDKPARPQTRGRVPDGKQEKGKVRNIVVEDGGQRKAEPKPQPQPQPQPQPKPNRFVRLEDAALKIQSVFNGYMIRRTKPLKHLQTIQSVMKELAKFKTQASDPERVKVLRENMKEQLCFTEGLMQLQERLDSIQGVLPFVREARKAANRDLSRFQEKVDAMIKGEQPEEQEAVAEDMNEETSASEVTGDMNEEASAPEVTENMNEEASAPEVTEVESEMPEADVTGSMEALELVDGGEQPEVGETPKQDPQAQEQDMLVDVEKREATEEDTPASVVEKRAEEEKPVASLHEEMIDMNAEQEFTEAEETLEQKPQEGTTDTEASGQVNDPEISGAEETLVEQQQEGTIGTEAADQVNGEPELPGAEETPVEQNPQEETMDMEVAGQVKDEARAEHTNEEDVVEKAVLFSEEPKCEGMDMDSNNCSKKRERESDSQTEAESSVEKLVKKLMDDNAQLKALVAECLKQKAVQNSVLLELTKRVERLEKKSKRKNKDCIHYI